MVKRDRGARPRDGGLVKCPRKSEHQHLQPTCERGVVGWHHPKARDKAATVSETGHENVGRVGLGRVEDTHVVCA